MAQGGDKEDHAPTRRLEYKYKAAEDQASVRREGAGMGGAATPREEDLCA